jgi:hypothetical protein
MLSSRDAARRRRAGGATICGNLLYSSLLMRLFGSWLLSLRLAFQHDSACDGAFQACLACRCGGDDNHRLAWMTL